MIDFKFFQPEDKERVFTQWMDEMDDYHLGGIRTIHPKQFTLNVIDNLFGRIPSYTFGIEPYNGESAEIIGTIGDLINGRFGIPGRFTDMIIQRDGNIVEVNHNNVDYVNQRGLIFDREDRVIIRYKLRQ
jgi:hypothetical protein